MINRKASYWLVGISAALAPLVVLAASGVEGNVTTGQAAFQDFSKLKPGQFRKITAADLPEPFATKSASNGGRLVPRPENAWPQAPEGFKVELYAAGLIFPRQMRTAPNGDVFLAETSPRTGEIKIFRGVTADGKPAQTSTFATGLTAPFGINFYPPGPNPSWVYVTTTTTVVRFAYKNGDLKATGEPQTIVSDLPPAGNHTTRDVVFSSDGKKMFVAVGSASNVDDPDTTPREFHRADILQYTPDGTFVKVYGSGIRNPVGLAINPTTGELWCSVNERDELGDNLVPDYITSVKDGGFYGWPWYYMGDHQDPRHAGKHPELKGKVIVPDVLMPPHNASLGMMFYEGKQFPKEYAGDIFAAEHGSWNRAVRTGYEVVRVPLKNGHATGEFEDFLTGFVTAEGGVWGRPVGVTALPDGSLLVSDDGTKSIWRVSWVGKK